MRRSAAPAALLTVLAVAGAVAVWPATGGRGAGDATTVAPGAPVLTARRVPALVAATLGRRRLAAGLEWFAADEPGPACLLVTADRAVIFSRDPDAPLLPASTMKLLTAAVALQVIGADVEVAVPAGRTATVAELVVHMLRESDNRVADALLAEVVRRGAATGADAGLAALADAGLPVHGVRVADGSGLSRENRATCRILHDVVARSSEGGPVLDGLPVGGRTGTLADRFDEIPLAGNVHAKTGQIRGVAALVGYVDTAAGRLTFAYLANGVVDGSAGEARQEELARTLARFGEYSSVPHLDPRFHPAVRSRR